MSYLIAISVEVEEWTTSLMRRCLHKKPQNDQSSDHTEPFAMICLGGMFVQGTSANGRLNEVIKEAASYRSISSPFCPLSSLNSTLFRLRSKGSLLQIKFLTTVLPSCARKLYNTKHFISSYY